MEFRIFSPIPMRERLLLLPPVLLCDDARDETAQKHQGETLPSLATNALDRIFKLLCDMKCVEKIQAISFARL